MHLEDKRKRVFKNFHFYSSHQSVRQKEGKKEFPQMHLGYIFILIETKTSDSFIKKKRKVSLCHQSEKTVY
jgi:hypothetical protein